MSPIFLGYFEHVYKFFVLTKTIANFSFNIILFIFADLLFFF